MDCSTRCAVFVKLIGGAGLLARRFESPVFVEVCACIYVCVYVCMLRVCMCAYLMYSHTMKPWKDVYTSTQQSQQNHESMSEFTHKNHSDKNVTQLHNRFIVCLNVCIMLRTIHTILHELASPWERVSIYAILTRQHYTKTCMVGRAAYQSCMSRPCHQRGCHHCMYEMHVCISMYI